eukprot:356884-Chlamydomonas_euryale.AAC.3
MDIGHKNIGTGLWTLDIRTLGLATRTAGQRGVNWDKGRWEKNQMASLVWMYAWPQPDSCWAKRAPHQCGCMPGHSLTPAGQNVPHTSVDVGLATA